MKDKIAVAVQAVYQRIQLHGLPRTMIDELCFIAGMEYAAAYLDDHPVDRSCLAKAIRTLADGEEPCEDCGYPLPSHDPSCVSRNLK